MTKRKITIFILLIIGMMCTFSACSKDSILQDFKNAIKLEEIIGEPGWEEIGIFILAELPEEDITLYGLKDENGTYENVAIRSGNNITYFDWSYYPGKIDTMMSYKDYDEDGYNELAVTIYLGGGTGVSVNQLFMLEETDPGSFESIEFKKDDYIKQLEEMIKYRIDEEKHIITFYNGEKELHTMDISDFKNENISGIVFGNIVGFDINQDIHMTILPGIKVNDWTSLQYVEDSCLEAEVKYQKEGTFKLVFYSGKKNEKLDIRK